MNSIEKKIEDEVLKYFKSHSLKTRSQIFVAFSGGPDSTALLIVLSQLSHILGFSLKAAYVNHGMRDEQELHCDDEFVSSLCQSLNIELFVKKIDRGFINESAKNNKRSAEDIAREIRYDFFHSLIAKDSNSYVALGHNKNDQMETMMYRFFQGSSMSGLKGIPSINGILIRPLLTCEKKEIIEYLATKDQKFRIDPSNGESLFLRNKIRNNLIPLVEEIFPGYIKSLGSLEKKLHDVHYMIEKETENLCCFFTENGCSVPLVSFNLSYKTIQLNMLYKMFDYTYDGNIRSFRLNEGFFHSILDKPLISNRVYAKAHNLCIYSDEKSLVFKKEKGQTRNYYYIYKEDTLNILDEFTIDSKINSSIKIESVPDSPLIIRNYKSDDVIFINNKYKLVKSIYKKWGIDHSLSNIIPIIEDSEGIIAILGEAWGQENLYRNKEIHPDDNLNILYLSIVR